MANELYIIMFRQLEEQILADEPPRFIVLTIQEQNPLRCELTAPRHLHTPVHIQLQVLRVHIQVDL